MENAIYVFAAYAVIWLLSLAYIFSIAQRQQSLRQEIDALKSAILDESQTQPARSVLNQS